MKAGTATKTEGGKGAGDLAAAEVLRRIMRVAGDDLLRTEERLREMMCSRYACVSTLTGYLEQFHGKRLRPALLHLSARAFGGEAPAAVETAAAVEMLHLASLCHDDVLDGASSRRGVPTLNAARSGHTAVLTGDFLVARAFERLSAGNNIQPLRILSAAARCVCEGELLQVASRFDPTLDEETYLDLVDKKTASLFAAAAELGALLAGAREENGRRMRAYGRHLGVAFQVVDDCLDLIGKEKIVGKTLGADLKNGEFTLPVIHFLRAAAPADRREVLAFLQPNREALPRARLLALLEGTGSLEYSFGAAREELRKARSELETLPSSAAKAALSELTKFVLLRRK